MFYISVTSYRISIWRTIELTDIFETLIKLSSAKSGWNTYTL